LEKIYALNLYQGNCNMIGNKKGISNVVMTILVVLLVLVAIGILWALIAGFLQRGTEQGLGEAECLDIRVSIEEVKLIEIAGVNGDNQPLGYEISIARDTGGPNVINDVLFEFSDGSQIVEISSEDFSDLNDFVDLRQLELDVGFIPYEKVGFEATNVRVAPITGTTRCAFTDEAPLLIQRTFEGQSDISVNKEITMPSSGTVNAGEVVIYGININNNGVDDAGDVILFDTIPLGFAFVSTNRPSECNLLFGTISCNFGSLEASGAISVEITMRPSATLSTGNYTNTIKVTSNSLDSNLDNNEASVGIRVIGRTGGGGPPGGIPGDECSADSDCNIGEVCNNGMCDEFTCEDLNIEFNQVIFTELPLASLGAALANAFIIIFTFGSPPEGALIDPSEIPNIPSYYFTITRGDDSGSEPSFVKFVMSNSTGSITIGPDAATASLLGVSESDLQSMLSLYKSGSNSLAIPSALLGNARYTKAELIPISGEGDCEGVPPGGIPIAFLEIINVTENERDGYVDPSVPECFDSDAQNLLLVGDSSGQLNAKRAFLNFDISGIPDSATIVDVSLDLFLSETTGSTGILNITDLNDVSDYDCSSSDYTQLYNNMGEGEIYAGTDIFIGSTGGVYQSVTLDINSSLKFTEILRSGVNDFRLGVSPESDWQDGLYNKFSDFESGRGAYMVITYVDIEIPSVCLGDTNNDGIINSFDIAAVQNSIGTYNCNVGDANGDCIVNNYDALLVVSNFGSVCSDSPVCGNGILETDERCDDGDTASGDGCSNICNDEVSGPVCANGIWEIGEECDDGNAVRGDGCSDLCMSENLICRADVNDDMVVDQQDGDIIQAELGICVSDLTNICQGDLNNDGVVDNVDAIFFSLIPLDYVCSGICFGDADRNGVVNGLDLTTVQTYFGVGYGQNCDYLTSIGDADGSCGFVNAFDLAAVKKNFGSYC
jgi:uncharacterized repeat protein (TIGR01451 family)